MARILANRKAQGGGGSPSGPEIQARSAVGENGLRPAIGVGRDHGMSDGPAFSTHQLLIPKAACFWTSECSAGVSPAWVSRSMAGETPALQ